MELHRSASETQKFGSIKRATKSQNYQLELKSGRKQLPQRKIVTKNFRDLNYYFRFQTTVFVVVDIDLYI